MSPTAKYCLLLLTFCMANCVDLRRPEKPTPLNYNGNPISITDAPFMGIFLKDGYICGAAIIHRIMLLSAAHCNKRSGRPEVFVGTDKLSSDFKPVGGKNVPIKRIQNHPDFRGDAASFKSDFNYDLCVIVLASTLTFSDKVKPVPLGFHFWDTDLMPREEESMSLYGFGVTETTTVSEELRTVELQYVIKTECQEVYTKEDNDILPDNIFCARGEKGKGGCAGDSGGPLVYKGHLLGILSSISDASCTGQPSITYFTHVPSMRTFIERIMLEDWEIACAFKVTGGRSVSISEAPFVASFKLEDKRYTCAATIIHEQFLVSNAHCLQNTALMEAPLVINVGHESNDGGGIKYAVDKIFIHPKYNENNYDRDLAVIKLREKITWTDKIRKIDILGATDNGIVPPGAQFPVLGTRDEPPHGTYLAVYGFAEDSDEGHARLHRLNLPSYNLRDCQYLYYKTTSYYLTDYQICAGAEGYQNYCAGDSSAPLIYNGTLIGIASWGKASCELGYPSIFTNVPLLYPFIDEIIQKNK